MVEIHHLAAGYGGQPVLHSLDVSFHTGELTVIVGPNGSGKSTLLRTLVGLTTKMAGSITLGGKDFQSLSASALAQQIAYLPQNKRAPDMTVAQLVLHGRFPYLHYPRRYRQSDRDKAHAAMEQLGIAHLADTPVPQLSGGTQQKCYIAMALCQDSPVILMDEPLSFLDISHQLDLMALVKDLARQGKAMVLVLHDLALALQWADRIILLADGVIRQIGCPEELLSSGQLEAVFGVQIHRREAPLGYTFSRKEETKCPISPCSST